MGLVRPLPHSEHARRLDLLHLRWRVVLRDDKPQHRITVLARLLGLATTCISSVGVKAKNATPHGCNHPASSGRTLRNKFLQGTHSTPSTAANRSSTWEPTHTTCSTYVSVANTTATNPPWAVAPRTVWAAACMMVLKSMAASHPPSRCAGQPSR